MAGNDRLFSGLGVDGLAGGAGTDHLDALDGVGDDSLAGAGDRRVCGRSRGRGPGLLNRRVKGPDRFPPGGRRRGRRRP
ncbi:MAG: hypothetical protein ABR540_17840 [Acidimicrobiales bacterium]